MNEFFLSLEETGVGIYMRESNFGFPTALTVHTLGLCFLIGANFIVAARVLGIASTIPLKPLRRVFPLMWVGLLLLAVSGLAVGIAHASTRLLNPIMGIKFLAILIAAPLMWMMQKKFDDPRLSEGALAQDLRMLAALQMVLWMAVLVMGRLLAYSATVLGEGY
jgi:hypothetical protein